MKSWKLHECNTVRLKPFALSLNGTLGYLNSIVLKLVLPLLALLSLAGCATSTPKAPVEPRLPPTFKETDAHMLGPSSKQPPLHGAWWTVFADARLDELLERADQGNAGIHIAAANLAKARALVRGSNASRLPRLNVNGAGDLQSGPLINSAGSSGTLWTASANLSYEVDVMGRLAKDGDAAALDAASREALLRSVRLMVQAEVAQNYFELRSLVLERALLADGLDLQRGALRLAERRLALGTVAEFDVARLQVELATAESDAMALERRAAELQNALAVLVGQMASSFDAPMGSSDSRSSSAWVLPAIPAGIPADLLVRRPDILAARQSMVAAQTRMGISRSAWFPNITLSTTQGFASPTLGDLITASSRAWGVSALLSLPLFDGGRREAAVQGASADLDVALAKYREQILLAVREVEDQLAALRILHAQERVQDRAMAAGLRSRVLASSRYEHGLSGQLELQDAQRTELRIRRQALQLRAARFQATVALIRALGGGWSS